MSRPPHLPRLPRSFRLAALALAALLSACGTNPIVVGPPGLQAATDYGPHCGPQQYPFNALVNHVQGDVPVQVAVDAAGKVTQAVLDRPGVQPSLEPAALQAVGFCRFAPAAAARQVDLLVVYAFVGEGRHLPNGVVRIGLRPAGTAH